MKKLAPVGINPILFFFNDTAPTELYTLSLHDALPICAHVCLGCLAVPAGVGFEGGGAEGFEPAEQVAQPPVVVDPGLVVAVLVGAEPAADRFGGDLAGPLPVRAVQAGRVGVAAAVGAAAAGAPV